MTNNSVQSGRPFDLADEPVNSSDAIAPTPASKTAAVVIDLTSSPSSTRSRSPIETNHLSDSEDDQFPPRPRRAAKSREARSRKRKEIEDVDDEVKILPPQRSGSNSDSASESRSTSESSCEDEESEKVEDGIIGMRIRTPGRKST